MAILKFSASAVAAQIAHARACKTFLPNWNGPVDRPALILIVGNGVHLRSNGIDGTTTRIVTTEQADPSFAFADGMNPFRDTDWMAQRRMAFRDLTGQFYTDILDDVQVLIDRGAGGRSGSPPMATASVSSCAGPRIISSAGPTKCLGPRRHLPGHSQGCLRHLRDRAELRQLRGFRRHAALPRAARCADGTR